MWAARRAPSSDYHRGTGHLSCFDSGAHDSDKEPAVLATWVWISATVLFCRHTLHLALVIHKLIS